MGVVLTVVGHAQTQDRFHVGCTHPGSAWTWYVSDDGYWLIVKSDSGVPREQMPMVSIRRLLVDRCEHVEPGSGPRRVSDAPCTCGKVKLTPEETSWVEPGPVGMVHHLEIPCGR